MAFGRTTAAAVSPAIASARSAEDEGLSLACDHEQVQHYWRLPYGTVYFGTTFRNLRF
jgi:hypothetical protein